MHLCFRTKRAANLTQFCPGTGTGKAERLLPPSASMNKKLLLLLLLIFTGRCYADTMDIETAFSRIRTEAGSTLELANLLPLQNRGGHLQGIAQQSGHFVVSGSSSDYAYLAIISATTGEVSRIERLRDKPLKHAGGFQIAGDWMAVGVEDNKTRVRSEILVYKGWSGDTSLPPPITTISRSGDYERATAGAVGITQLDDAVWLVVGDWDSRHLDFYRASPVGRDFALAFSLTLDLVGRESWIDTNWASYQNLNLFSDQRGLWLIGTTTIQGDHNNGIEIADLYKVDILSRTLTKVAARQFQTAPGTHFRWGAGLHRSADGSLVLMATPEHLPSHPPSHLPALLLKNRQRSSVIRTYQSR